MPNFKPLKSPSLFWQLFFSLLAVLMLTAISSVALERYWASRTLDRVMQTHIDHLVNVRQTLATALSHDDWQSVRAIYEQDPRLNGQIQITDGNSNVLTPFSNRHDRTRRGAPYTNGNHPNRPPNPDSFVNESKNRENRQPPFAPIGIDPTQYPELADLSVSSPTTNYTIRLSPRLPLHEVRKAERNQGNWFLSVLASLLISVAVCYLLSRAITRRIATVQHMVQRLSQQTASPALLSTNQVSQNTEQTQWQTDLEQLQTLGEDELGQLGKDVAQLSQRLATSEHARQQMLSDISHELRSPLARLDVATELIRDRLQDEPIADTTLPYLNRIERESNRLGEMIGQILQIQRLQLASPSSNRTNDFTPVDLLALLHRIGDDVQFEFQHKSIALHISKNLSLTINGDADGLRSAFENIIRNAFLHTPEGGNVYIDVAEIADENSPSFIQISIQDEGGGIEEADHERLFEPFVRLDSARSRHSGQGKSKDGGYGLGLAIAKAVIIAHNGTIEAQNVMRDKMVTGLMVKIRLPKHNKTA